MSPATEAASVDPVAPSAERRRFLPPGWPYLAMVALYPLWWALGIGAFTWTLFAVPMAAALYLSRPIRAPRGTGLLLLFLLCVLVSAIQVDTADRMAGYVLRTSYYVAAFVVWLYLANNEDRLPGRRVMGALLVLWGSAIVGGWLGLAFAGVSWSGPAAALLPEGLRENALIIDLVTPGFAEVTDVVGVTITRPKAPFTYTNGWGSTMALLTPVALAALSQSWLTPRSRRLVRVGLVASAVPIIASLNRGLWALLLLGGLYVVLRRSPGGRSRAAAMVFLALLAVTTAVVATPLGDPVREALDTRTSDSNTRRELLYEETFERTLDSPVLGYGAPRPAQRTNQSLGSHGQIWTVMFSHGLFAAALFAAFVASLAWRSRNPTTMGGTWLHVALLVGLAEMLFYGQLPQQLFIIVSVGALILRESAPGPDAPPPRTS